MAQRATLMAFAQPVDFGGEAQRSWLARLGRVVYWGEYLGWLAGPLGLPGCSASATLTGTALDLGVVVTCY